ncbi:hypothetical protein H4Q26_016015 [Puccinia striiformis f. sp. tritici PST-130]|nr:hypothetical protein H4Q26_016015 [Puccinia striiformis f. sp. tritici PST-130]
MQVATVCEGECQVASIPFQASNPVTDVLQTTRQGLSDNDILSLISSPMSAPEKFVSQGMIPQARSRRVDLPRFQLYRSSSCLRTETFITYHTTLFS